MFEIATTVDEARAVDTDGEASGVLPSGGRQEAPGVLPLGSVRQWEVVFPASLGAGRNGGEHKAKGEST